MWSGETRKSPASSLLSPFWRIFPMIKSLEEKSISQFLLCDGERDAALIYIAHTTYGTEYSLRHSLLKFVSINVKYPLMICMPVWHESKVKKMVLLKYCMDWKDRFDVSSAAIFVFDPKNELRLPCIIESFDQRTRATMEQSRPLRCCKIFKASGESMFWLIYHHEKLFWSSIKCLLFFSSVLLIHFISHSSNLQQIQQIILLRNWWLFILFQHLWKCIVGNYELSISSCVCSTNELFTSTLKSFDNLLSASWFSHIITSSVG